MLLLEPDGVGEPDDDAHDSELDWFTLIESISPSLSPHSTSTAIPLNTPLIHFIIRSSCAGSKLVARVSASKNALAIRGTRL
jgi:hypothetical protein